ncbi:MAG: type II toxin-antitoxin system VapC family toxin [Synechococcaceae cyanobacterium]|nr:type II toxin-antitoxin system VapC family toxin [Synechococcaceae cyanobacterium]
MTLPVALDTNLLARLLTGDDPEQALRAAELIDGSPACYVPITVVLELEWVLRGAYRLQREAVITALESLMAIRQVHLEQEDLVRQALRWHQRGLDFAGALHLLRSEGCACLATLDRAFVNAAAELGLQPEVRLV